MGRVLRNEGDFLTFESRPNWIIPNAPPAPPGAVERFH